MTELLREVYEHAGREKMWWLVRHTAGLLKMRVGGLEGINVSKVSVF